MAVQSDFIALVDTIEAIETRRKSGFIGNRTVSLFPFDFDIFILYEDTE